MAGVRLQGVCNAGARCRSVSGDEYVSNSGMAISNFELLLWMGLTNHENRPISQHRVPVCSGWVLKHRLQLHSLSQ